MFNNTERGKGTERGRGTAAQEGQGITPGGRGVETQEGQPVRGRGAAMRARTRGATMTNNGDCGRVMVISAPVSEETKRNNTTILNQGKNPLVPAGRILFPDREFGDYTPEEWAQVRAKDSELEEARKTAKNADVNTLLRMRELCKLIFPADELNPAKELFDLPEHIKAGLEAMVLEGNQLFPFDKLLDLTDGQREKLTAILAALQSAFPGKELKDLDNEQRKTVFAQAAQPTQAAQPMEVAQVAHTISSNKEKYGLAIMFLLCAAFLYRFL